MANDIKWRLIGADRNPFENNGRRLRITVHSPNEDQLTAPERQDLALLRELAYIDTVRIVETQPGPRWNIAVNCTLNQYGSGRVTFLAPDGSERVYHAFRPRDWVDDAIRFRRIGSRTDSSISWLGQQLMFVEAHEQCYRDIFATTHTELLAGRERRADANIRSLSETLQLLGLWLRRDGEIPIKAGPLGATTFREDFGLDLFRWVATRDRLPAMWRYFSACLIRGKETGDKTEYLGNTILDRCVRVMQAVDEIGWQFHRSQNNSTRDSILYHFDYLTLLLSGALDTQARVCRIAYRLSASESRSSFRNPQLIKQLQAAGATKLADALTSTKYSAFQKLLGALRNSIHGAGLRGLGYVRGGEPERSLVQIFEEDRVIWEESGTLGRSAVGVVGVGGVRIEPYTCANWLARTGLQWINLIAQLTDVERLLSSTPRELRDGPPDDRHWNGDTRRRVSALAWGSPMTEEPLQLSEVVASGQPTSA
jgi:hypothetical protein